MTPLTRIEMIQADTPLPTGEPPFDHPTVADLTKQPGICKRHGCTSPISHTRGYGRTLCDRHAREAREHAALRDRESNPRSIRCRHPGCTADRAWLSGNYSRFGFYRLYCVDHAREQARIYYADRAAKLLAQRATPTAIALIDTDRQVVQVFAIRGEPSQTHPLPVDPADFARLISDLQASGGAAAFRLCDPPGDASEDE